MTTVVQRPSVTNVASATSMTVNLSATAVGNSLILVAPIGDGGAASPNFTISNGGTPLTWKVRHSVLKGTGNNWRLALIADALNAPTSTTSVTITDSNLTQMFGGAVVFEISGGTGSLDISGNGDNAGSVTTTTATATGTESSTTDFLCAVVSTPGDNSHNIHISTPATGNAIGYTSAYVQQDDGSFQGGEISFRVETSAVVNPAATWSWTGATAVSAAIAAYRFATSAGSGTAAGAFRRSVFRVPRANTNAGGGGGSGQLNFGSAANSQYLMIAIGIGGGIN